MTSCDVCSFSRNAQDVEDTMSLAQYGKTLQLLSLRWSLSKSLPTVWSLFGLCGGLFVMMSPAGISSR